MRQNMPVTGTEYLLEDGKQIVSRTNLKGIITFCNPEFVEASGYSEKELMGEPHNLLRHPDMPPAAFAWLWDTIKKGRPWSGLVKNRRKNGDFYWVEANVTPEKQGGQIVSYLSVRRKPTRAQVEGADRLYKAINAGKVNLSDVSLLTRWKRLPVSTKLTVSNLLTVMLGAAVSVGIGSTVSPLWSYVADIPILAIIGAVMYAQTRSLLAVPLHKAVKEITEIAQGNYNRPIVIGEYQDELGDLFLELKSMQTKLGFDVADAARVAYHNLRVKVALDSITSPVTLSNEKNALIYLNPAATALFEKMAPEICKRLPSFTVNGLMDNKVSQIFEDEGLKADYALPFQEHKVFDTQIAGHSIRLSASPVYAPDGSYGGRVTQWTDRTNELVSETEVSQLVTAAASGDFGQRLNVQGKEGFFLQLYHGINKLVETSDRGMNDVARVLKSLAAGDLTQRIDADYHGLFGQLKEDTNATTERLQSIVAQIRESTDSINTAAREISSGNADLSSRTESQASSLEETAASMEQLTSTVKQNADNSRQANQLAKGASDIAVKGGAVVGEVVQTMGHISESSKKIADIISVIDGIAFQTNILALNAAVEAARAGEQGRGFAVVAGEVRSLAQRSAAAAKEIKDLISESVDKVGQGHKLVTQAGNTMAEVVNAVKRVTDIMGEISSASIEQSQGIEQVNTAITQMDETTQQNAALVEEAAAAAESLQEQASELSEAVSVFKTGPAAHARPSAAHTTKGHAAVRPVAKPVARPPTAAPQSKVAKKPDAKPIKPVTQKSDDEEWEEF